MNHHDKPICAIVLIGVFSHAKRTLLPGSRRDRYRTYELDKTVLRVIVVILFLSQISECDVGIFPCHINNIRRMRVVVILPIV